MGKSDAQAAKACGRTRDTVNLWKNHDPLFMATLNIEQNKVVQATMLRYRQKMATMTEAAFAGVSAAIKRGDAATARWFLDSIGFGEFARQIFQREVDPVLLPEGLDAVIDAIAAARVDAYLTTREIGALERLRLRPILILKEAAALRDEQGDNGPEE